MPKTKSKPKPKAQRSPKKYLRSSIAFIEGSGSKGQKPHDFNYRVAVEQFYGWCHAAAMLNAKGVASNPLRLYVRKSVGKKLWPTRAVPAYRKRFLFGEYYDHKPGPLATKNLYAIGDDLEEVTDHPLLTLLRNVNEYENGYGSTILRILFGELTGNAYLHPIIGPLGVPSELWTMPSQWTWVIPDRSQFIKGYVYGKNIAQPDVVYEPDEIIHFKRPNPRSLFYGLGNVEAAWRALCLHNSKTAMDQATFDNMARPDYAIIVNGGGSRDALDRLEERYNRKLRGPKNQGRMLAMTGDVTITPMQWKPNEVGDAAQVIEIIASVFGVPVAKLKANQNVAGGQAETSSGDYPKDTIWPLCVMDAEVLNARLVPMFDLPDGEAVLCYDDPIPKNRDLESKISIAFVGAGVKLINEERIEMGLEPIEGGDVARVNGVPLDMVGQQASTGDAGAEGPEASAPALAENDPAAPQHEPAEGQAAAVATNDLRQTVGGFTAMVSAQQAYYDGKIPRDAAMANAILFFGFTDAEAQQLFPELPPDAPKSEEQIAREEAELVAMQQPKAPPPGKGYFMWDGKNMRSVQAMIPYTDVLDESCPTCGNGHAHNGHAKHETVSMKALWTKAEADRPYQDRGTPGFRKEIDDVLQEQAKAAIQAIEATTLPRSAIDAAIAEIRKAEWVEKLADAARPFIETSVDVGGKAGISALRGAAEEIAVDLPSGVGFDVFDRRVQQFVDQASVRLASSVNGTTEVAARELLGEGLKSGESVPELASRIENWTQANPEPSIGSPAYRARMIARTESSRAYTRGTIESWKQSGVVEGRKWLLAPDACPICEALAAEFNASVSLDKAFIPKGGQRIIDGKTIKFDYDDVQGGDAHPNCACSIEPVFVEVTA